MTWDAGLSAGYVLRLDVALISQNIANNTSTFDWNLYIVKGPGSGKWSGWTTYWSFTIDGGTIGEDSQAGYDFRDGQNRSLGNGRSTVTHSADGTKSVNLIGGFSEPTDTQLGSNSTGGWWALPTIPRATSATFTNPMVAGQTYTITLPRASSSFTHSVDLYFGDIVALNIVQSAGASFTWTPPMSLLDEMPTTTLGTGYIRVHTVSGSTYVGNKDFSLTIQAPASVVPTFTTVTATEATTGVAANIGGFVQGISKLALALTGAAGAYSSTIVSRKITVDGQTINAATGTTPSAISKSGTVPIVGTITDSRGRTATKTINVTVLAYSPPTITAITAQRALSSGVVNDDGTYARVNINASVQSLIVSTQKNAMTYKIYSRLRGNTTWTLKSTTVATGVSFNGFKVEGIYSILSAWDVLVEIIDDFATSSIQVTIATAAIFQHWDAALGVGIGKYRTNGMLDVLGQIFQNDGWEVEPAGNIVMTARTSAPSGWLLCQGQSVSRTTYDRLFAAIGTRYGAGDGSTTFLVPDFRGRTAVGVDTTQTEFDALGEKGGAKTHTLAVTEMPAHTHKHAINSTNGQFTNAGGTGMDNRGTENGVTSSTGGGGAHNNLQPYIAMHYIIKL